ncbi:hypothetical protein CORC01_05729 [Colletotrichum orchidophilum]|uniref:Uncharacterized protein n=1 Tax=Colletotrichum orchidophilum TaxID=1209926 RepID=A0A1G4BCA1_9PEZI|nr:uncharacterized protein CORC01_05729 [Colletotrichum orchidophilum]OHE99039.1 hypothetical protein CORC01_05729 [Colletotrichum orchidophilum]
MWDASSGESRGGAGAGPTDITGLQLEARVGPGTDALSRSRSGTNDAIGAAAVNGYGQGGSGAGAGAGGAIGRRTSSLKTTGSPQKKLTPPPQLRERNLLKSGPVSVDPREGHIGAHPYHRQSPATQPQPQHQLLHQDTTSSTTTTTTQQITVHLRGGGSAGPHQQYQPVQPYQYQVPGRGGPPPPASTSGASRSRDTIANYNRLRRETQHNSTSTLHHRNYWPDNFRNPRGGLGIEHNVNSPDPTATTPRNENQFGRGGIQKFALEESGAAEE